MSVDPPTSVTFVLNGRRFELTSTTCERKLAGQIPEHVQQHAVRVEETWYPVKQAFEAAVGVARREFTSQVACRHLSALGFELRGSDERRPAPAPRRRPTQIQKGRFSKADLLLVTCVKEKRGEPAAAKDLYISTLFKKERAYAEATGLPWYILSAEHGLVMPDDWLAPYERYLPDEPPAFQRAWGRRVIERLELRQGPLTGHVVEIHASEPYVDALRDPLAEKGASVLEPLAGLRMGERLAWYSNEARADSVLAPTAGAHEHVAATEFCARLRHGHAAISPAKFLAAGSEGLTLPGLYSWWVDEVGAGDLSRGLHHRVEPGLIYAGLAGATRWPSGKRSTNTLWSRIAGMHLGKKHEFSTFRRTLGAVLTSASGTDAVDEVASSEWMHAHLRVLAIPYDDADTLGRLESDVLRSIDPPLNLMGMPSTPLRQQLTRLRKRVNV